MITINLLPWREKKREQDKRCFLITLLLSAVVVCFSLLLMHCFVGYRLDYQRQGNDLLHQEIAQLESQLQDIKRITHEKNLLLTQTRLLHELQSQGTLVVHLLDELVKVMPLGVYLTKLERNNEQVTLWGCSDSNSSISTLMRSMEVNEWITKPKLSEIQTIDTKKQGSSKEFQLSFQLKARALHDPI